MTRSVTVSSAGPVHGGRQAAGTVYSSSKVKQPVSQQYTDYSNLSKPYSSSKVKQQLFTTRYRCSNLNKRVAQNLCRRKAISLVCLHHTDLKKKIIHGFYDLETVCSLLKLNESAGTRECPLKLHKKKPVLTNYYAHFFTNRVGSSWNKLQLEQIAEIAFGTNCSWNKLPPNIVLAGTLNSFKNIPNTGNRKYGPIVI